jgi:hypothetical protein
MPFSENDKTSCSKKKLYESLHNSRHYYQRIGFHEICIHKVSLRLNRQINLCWLKYFELAKRCFILTNEKVFFNNVRDSNLIDAFTYAFPDIQWRALYRNTKGLNHIVANPYNISSVRSQVKSKFDVYVSDSMSDKPSMYEKYIEAISGLSLISNGGSLLMSFPTVKSKWYVNLLSKLTNYFTQIYLCRPSVTHAEIYLFATGFKGITIDELENLICLTKDNMAYLKNSTDNICSSYYFNLVNDKFLDKLLLATTSLAIHQDEAVSYHMILMRDRVLMKTFDSKIFIDQADRWIDYFLTNKDSSIFSSSFVWTPNN